MSIRKTAIKKNDVANNYTNNISNIEEVMPYNDQTDKELKDMVSSASFDNDENIESNGDI